MFTVSTDQVIVSGVIDLQDQPFDVDVNVDDLEYAAIMRRFDRADGKPGTQVSAFNSSI